MHHYIKVLFIAALFVAQNMRAMDVVVHTVTTKIDWQPMVSDTLNRPMLRFAHASYPNENFLPHYNASLKVDRNKTYSATIANAVYAPLTSKELAAFPQNVALTATPTIYTEILENIDGTRLQMMVFPFVKTNDEIKKLISFEYSIHAETKAQKAANNFLHKYAENSVLTTGKFVKIRVTETGIHRITFEDLVSMGVNPQNARVFGYGGNVLDQLFSTPKNDDLPEVAIHVEKGSDGIFNAGDYLLFYALGINKWSYDVMRSMFVHTRNSYSNYGYYFVSSDAGVGKTIQPKTVQVPLDVTVIDINEFTDYRVYEKELQSLVASGKEFYGETFGDKNSYTFDFNFPNALKTNSTKIRLDVAATASVPSTFALTLAGQTRNTTVSARNISDTYERAKGTNNVMGFTPNSDDFSVRVDYLKPNSSAIAYLNYIEVNAMRSLKMVGAAMQFQSDANIDGNYFNRYKLADAGADIQIWDVTLPHNTQRMTTTTQNNAQWFVDSNKDVRTYIAVNTKNGNAFPKVEIVGPVDNQNLHALQGIDFVIIAHPDFVDEANRLAQAHREIDFLTVAVVSTEQVYNEFSSGTPDATAYRWLMKMLYDKAARASNAQDRPKYLLLFGRGTFDNRKLLNSKESGDNFVLTYQADNSLVKTLSYVTDDYFAFLDDSQGLQIPSHALRIGVGRFPVRNTKEAADVVTKNIHYMQNKNKGIWKNQLCFVADDGDGALHMNQADSITNVIGRNHSNYIVNKIYLDSYYQESSAVGKTYPLARTQLQNNIRNGVFMLNFTGHASSNGWTGEGVLYKKDVEELSNKNLPFWVGATCDFLEFDIKQISAGELVLLNPAGGGIGILSAARPVYASQNFSMNRFFNEYAFQKVDGKHLRVGDIIREAKNRIGSEINKLSYVYMGNPALMLNYPTKYEVKTTHINGVDLTQATDTLRATSVTTIKGFVADDNGQRVSGFKGEVHAIVYDKVQTITTRNNSNGGSMTYNDRPNILFSGKALVNNGEFTLTFMMPKDIKYNFGLGRINYYAFDYNNNGDEAKGKFENFVVGGSDSNFDQTDNEGPAIEAFFNSNHFKQGDKVNETPMFIAQLNDKNGINRVGSGIGHDLLLVVDNDSRQTYVLNDFYDSSTAGFESGEVRFKMPEMTNGKHTLTFRAWDLLNNSSTIQMEFEVEKGLNPQIFSVYNFPNPVSTTTQIKIVHDRPETVLDTQVDIFDLSGRQLWSFAQVGADDVQWDLQTADGMKVKKGVYLYRVTVNSKNSERVSKTNKMLVQ